MFLSIIIPVYNVELFIVRCLDSIFNQCLDLFDFEVILIDDGSKDNSVEVINNYGNKEYIRLIRQSNHGAGSARNRGIELATGKFIWFIDADDFLPDSDAFEILYQRLQNMASNCSIVFNYLKQQGESFHLAHNLQLWEEKIIDAMDYPKLGIPFYLWNGIFNKTVIDKYDIRFIEGIKNIEDFEFCIKYFDKIKYVNYIDNPFYAYCTNESSTSRNTSRENLLKLAFDSSIVHNTILTNIKSDYYINPRKVEGVLYISVLGFFYSLLTIEYNFNDLKKYYQVYSKEGLLSLKSDKLNYKAKIMHLILKNRIAFFLFAKLKKRIFK